MSNINEQTFTLILNNTKQFVLRITNFAVNLSLKILIHISSIHIATIVKQRIRIISNLKIPKIVFTYINHLRSRLPQTIILKSIKMSFVRRTLNREITNVLLRIRLSTIYRRRIRTLLSMKSGYIHMLLTPVVAVLIKLSTLDSQLLSSLDSQNLSQLDHS